MPGSISVCFSVHNLHNSAIVSILHLFKYYFTSREQCPITVMKTQYMCTEQGGKSSVKEL